MANPRNWYDAFLGTGGQFQESPNIYNQQQQGSLNQALSLGQQGLGTDAIEGLARRNYQQNTIPLLSERFAQAGGIGSSGYQNALQGAGSELEAKLAALRQGNAMDLLKLGLTPQTNQYFEEGSQGLLAPLIEAGGRVGAAYLSGGASEGGNILQWLKNLFSGQGGTEQAQPSQPAIFKQLQGQTGNQLLNQAAQNSIGLQRQGSMPNRGQVYQQAQRGGVGNIQQLISQANQAQLPSQARGVNLQSLLNRPYPGFEI